MPGYDARYTGPFSRAVAITPDDAADLATTVAALYIGGAGAVRVTTAGGDTVTFAAVPVGTVLRVRARRVFATSTTATNIVGLY